MSAGSAVGGGGVVSGLAVGFTLLLYLWRNGGVWRKGLQLHVSAGPQLPASVSVLMMCVSVFAVFMNVCKVDFTHTRWWTACMSLCAEYLFNL